MNQQAPTDSITLRHTVNSLPWHHQIDFGDGIISPGIMPLDELQALADIYFRDDITGKTVLDINCWDGFNSFEAERRGASRVLATDHFAWSDSASIRRKSFELARSCLSDKVEVQEIYFPHLSADLVGTFDVVLCVGRSLFHSKTPLEDLERIAPIANERLIIETHLDATDDPRPATTFTSGYGGDPANWGGQPNRACVATMLRDVGFSRAEFYQHPVSPHRGIFFGMRS